MNIGNMLSSTFVIATLLGLGAYAEPNEGLHLGPQKPTATKTIQPNKPAAKEKEAIPSQSTDRKEPAKSVEDGQGIDEPFISVPVK